MAGAPLAQAFVRVRVATDQLKKDVDAGLQSADGTAAGRRTGDQFAGGFKAQAASGIKRAASAISKAGLIAIAGVAVASTKMAADFQTGVDSLVTGAGESERNLGVVEAGIKRIAVASGTSTVDLVKGLYMIESAGYHGAAGLKVLQAAAEGAKVGDADLATVSDAVTTALKDYHLGGDAAVNVTDALVKTVASGKTHMQDLAGSLSKVLPTASALHVGLGQVGGAMATMTGHGVSARLAAMGLNSTMIALAAPTSGATKLMASLGGSSQHVAETLTHHGLVAALAEVSAMAAKAGPQGSPAYVKAMAGMLGGSRGLSVGLQLTGKNLATVRANTATVTGAMAKGSGSVVGWGRVTQTFNFQMAKLRAELQVAAITIGSKLLPVVTKLAGWLNRNQAIILPLGAALAIAVGAIALLSFTIKAVNVVTTVWGGLMKAQALILGATTTEVEGLTLAQKAQLAITRVMTGAQAALDAVMDANPFVLAAAAIIAVGVGLVILYKHSAAFRQIVQDTWGWIKAHWPLLLGILTGPVGLAVLFIVGHWHQITAAAADVLGWIREHWKLLLAILTGPFGLAVDAISTHWTAILHGGQVVLGWIHSAWSAVTGFLMIPVRIAAHQVEAEWQRILLGLKVIWHWISTGWDAVTGYLSAPVRAAVNRILAGWTVILGGAKQLITDIKNLFAPAVGWLVNAGKKVITGLFNGMLSMARSAGHWVSQVGTSILNAVKSFFGIHSDSRVMMPIGGHIIGGLVAGMVRTNPGQMIKRIFGGMPAALGHLVEKGLVNVAALPGRAMRALGNLGSKVGHFFTNLFGGGGGGGSGVTRWAGTILQVLKMLHQPAGDLGAVEHRMMQESGGNPRAVNLTDINAQMGDPSRGLMQTIGSTFNAYAGPFRGLGIYNPLANIYAGLNYALHAYPARSLASVMMQPGGYAIGGRITEPIFGVGQSGRHYSFGENGDETVLAGVGHGRAGGGDEAGLLDEIAGLLESVVDAVRAQPSRTAGALARALGSAGVTASTRDYYGAT